MKNTIKVNANALENICGWVIDDLDRGSELFVTWDDKKSVKVYADAEGGYLNEYRVDPETFFSQDLPTLQASNEIIEEETDAE